MDFNSLVDEYSSKIYNLAYRVTFNRDDADDIVQETFLQMYKSRDKFRGDSDIGTWIYRIALNNSLKAKKRITPEYLESMEQVAAAARNDIPEEVKSWFDDPEKTLFLKELTNEIRYGCQQVMMQELPDTQKTVFILRVIFDFSYKDIAGILEISEDVIKSRLKRARATLSRIMETKCGWVRGENEGMACCTKSIGFVLAQDTEILKRVHERVNEITNSHENIKQLNQNYINYIYKKLPQLSYNPEKIKKILS